jgi:HEPN domain-containing protein
MADALKLEAEAWLRRARDDLGVASKLLSGDDPFPATAAYHCQQAAEKALKAMIAGVGDTIPKTHDLRLLLGRCIQIDQSLTAFADTCDELTPYATEFRYPGDSPDPSPDQVRCAHGLADGIVEAVARRIQGPFSP